MYYITKLLNGDWLVECMIQDGWERWREFSRENAIHSLIRAAKTLNGAYIREDDIKELTEPEVKAPLLPDSELQLLTDIKRGTKKVLEFDHYLLKYRITQEEADIILAIREGRLKVICQ